MSAAALLRRTLLADPDHGWLPALLLILTVLSGVVDAVSILSLGRVFVANMTGNLVFVGFALGGASGFSLTASVIALGGFLLGVVACRMVVVSRPVDRIVMLRDTAATEVVLVAVATAISASVGAHPTAGWREVLAAVCAVALGMQNCVVGRLGVAELTTTVMTRTLVGLVSAWGVAGRGPGSTRQVLSVTALVAGAVGGAVLVRQVEPAVALGLAAALAALVAVAAAVTVRRAVAWR